MGKKGKTIIFISVALAIVLAVAYCIFFVFLPAKKQKEQRLLVEQYYQNKFALYAQENEQYADYEIDVAFLGDSLTDGYDLAKYYPQYKTANRGIGGETSFGLEGRMQLSLYDLKPKVAVLLIGGNNLDTMLDNYERLLQGIKQTLPQTQVVVLSLTAMGGDWAHKNAQATLNNVSIKGLAEKYECEYVDLFTPLFDITTGQVREGYTTDGAHFTPQGYEIVTAQITPVLEKLL
jgi:lysophospholipase L1-like esterase